MADPDFQLDLEAAADTRPAARTPSPAPAVDRSASTTALPIRMGVTSRSSSTTASLAPGLSGASGAPRAHAPAFIRRRYLAVPRSAPAFGPFPAFDPKDVLLTLWFLYDLCLSACQGQLQQVSTGLLTYCGPLGRTYYLGLRLPDFPADVTGTPDPDSIHPDDRDACEMVLARMQEEEAIVRRAFIAAVPASTFEVYRTRPGGVLSLIHI